MGRVGGKIFIAANGTRLDAKGSFQWNSGEDVREMVTGHDRVHGYKEMPQAPFIEGAITITPGLDVAAIKNLRDATITLELASNHVVVLRDAIYANEGTASTEEGELPVRFEGVSCDISNPST